MRELKFRAWVQPDSFNQKPTMFTGFGFADIYSGYDEANVYCKDGQTWAEPDWETAKLMQYTGLKDKNGKEIYEGDILKERTGKLSKVVWELDGWFVSGKWPDGYGPLSVQLPDAEVIGNVYENPELFSNVNRIKKIERDQ